MDMRGCIRHVEQRQEPRCVPGRAGGQLIALNQHGIPTAFSKMVGNGGPNCPATDNQCFYLRLHRARLLFALRVDCPKTA